MSPQLHDPRCPGPLVSTVLDDGEATFLRCSVCEYCSCSDNSPIGYSEQMEYPEQIGEDATGGTKVYENMSIDDLTYVWYPNTDSMQSPIDDGNYLTNEEPTYAETQHSNYSPCTVAQRNQTNLTKSEYVSIYARDSSQCKSAEDRQSPIRHSKPTPAKTTNDFSSGEFNELLELVPCPYCQKANTQVVEDELNIRCCKDCWACFGVDDSMDVGDVHRLLEAHKISVRSPAMCSCGNNDVDRLIFTGMDTVTGQPMIECQECFRKMALETVQDGDDEEFVEEDYQDSLNDDNQAEDTSLDSSDGLKPAALEKEVVTDQPSFHCDVCDNVENDLFEKRVDINGRVTSVKCFLCGVVQIIRPPMLCPVCRNNKDFDTCYDSDGNLIFSACLNCHNYLDLKKNTPAADDDIVRSPRVMPRWLKKQPVRKRIFSINDISVGDHVALHKEYVLWHHAIVVSVQPRDMKLTVVHYTGGLKKHQGHFTSVRQEELKVDFDKNQIYLYDYGKDCFPPQEVVERARSRLDEHRYNIFAQNCEHFAHWCKTGEGKSNQVKAFCRRLWKACGSAAGAGVREGVVAACRGLIEGIPAKQVFRVGLTGGIDRVQGVAGGAGLAAGLKGGAVLFDVFLNIALEAGLFAYCAYKSHQKYKSGDITKGEFHRELCQTGCECAGGLLGATGGSFLGQLAIPVPILGTMVGCTLGTLIGRFLGAIVGKKIADRFIDPM